MRAIACDIFDDGTNNQIRWTASRMIGKCGITRDELEDIEQELRIAVWKNLPRHDPSRAKLNTFVAGILKNRARQLLRERSACCRDWRNIESPYQDDPCMPSGDDDDGTDPFDRKSEEEIHARWHGAERDREEAVLLRLDTRKWIGLLLLEEKRLAYRLMVLNLTEIARETGVPRSTLHDQIMKLRRSAMNAGLDDYLDGKE